MRLYYAIAYWLGFRDHVLCACFELENSSQGASQWRDAVLMGSSMRKIAMDYSPASEILFRILYPAMTTIRSLQRKLESWQWCIVALGINCLKISARWCLYGTRPLAAEHHFRRA
jgi:hypothetical protein